MMEDVLFVLSVIVPRLMVLGLAVLGLCDWLKDDDLAVKWGGIVTVMVASALAVLLAT